MPLDVMRLGRAPRGASSSAQMFDCRRRGVTSASAVAGELSRGLVGLFTGTARAGGLGGEGSDFGGICFRPSGRGSSRQDFGGGLRCKLRERRSWGRGGAHGRSAEGSVGMTPVPVGAPEVQGLLPRSGRGGERGFH
jgi:hypothetical protein